MSIRRGEKLAASEAAGDVSFPEEKEAA